MKPERSTTDLLAHLRNVASGPLERATGAEPQLYWDADIAELEQAQIFRKDWVCPGLAAEIPETGDYMTFSVAGEPIYSIRDKTGA
ncbi:MAG: (2Fe-2S)-binding protein, partial [Albidovulum sp.]